MMAMGDDGDDVMDDDVEVVDDACFGMKEEDVYDEPVLRLGDGASIWKRCRVTFH